MTIGNLIDRIQQNYSKGVGSDDSRLEPTIIYSEMLSTRNQLIVRKAQKKQMVSQWNYTTLDCLKTVEAPITECDCVPDIIKKNCKVYKVECEFPEVISYKDNYLIETISNSVYTKEYSLVSLQDLKNVSGRKYTANVPRAYIRNSYLYLIDTVHPKQIQLSAVLNDPLDIVKVKDCSCSLYYDPCRSFYDYNFPIDSGLVESLVEMVVSTLINTYMKVPEDITNNSRDSRYESTK